MASVAAQHDPKIQHAISLLAEGTKPMLAAKRAGISPAYMSELQKLDWFQRGVAEIRKSNDDIRGMSRAGKIDELYDKVEYRLLKTVDENLELFNKPAMLERVLRTINSAKRRSEGEAQPASPETMRQRVVEINLPKFITKELVESKKNTQNEVVEVGGRTLLTQNSDYLLKEIREEDNRKVNGEHEYEGIKMDQGNEGDQDPDIVDLF